MRPLFKRTALPALAVVLLSSCSAGGPSQQEMSQTSSFQGSAERQGVYSLDASQPQQTIGGIRYTTNANAQVTDLFIDRLARDRQGSLSVDRIRFLGIWTDTEGQIRPGALTRVAPLRVEGLLNGRREILSGGFINGLDVRGDSVTFEGLAAQFIFGRLNHQTGELKLGTGVQATLFRFEVVDGGARRMYEAANLPLSGWTVLFVLNTDQAEHAP